MTKLGDKAEEAETEYRSVKNLNPGSCWRIVSEELVDADDLGSDEFPLHGEWLKTDHDGDVTYYLECPAGLASAIMDEIVARGAESAEGYWFKIVEKWRRGEDSDGAWAFDVELASADVETSEEATAALRDE